MCSSASWKHLPKHICKLENKVSDETITQFHNYTFRHQWNQCRNCFTRFQHGCTLPPLVVDNSEMGLKPISSYKPKHNPLRTLVLRLYLLTYLLTEHLFIWNIQVVSNHAHTRTLCKQWKFTKSEGFDYCLYTVCLIFSQAVNFLLSQPQVFC